MVETDSRLHLIVGLGNPEPVYDETRHNIGFQAVRALAKKRGWSFRKAAHLSADLAQGVAGEGKVLLLLPMTYMNSSGEAVRLCVDYFKVPLQHLLVVSDEVYLPFGTLRVKKGGSSGGHNGLKSIEQHVGTMEYPRLRIGVGDRQEGELADHVLSRFSPEEKEKLPAIVERAVQAIESWIIDGIDASMRLANVSKLDEEK